MRQQQIAGVKQAQATAPRRSWLAGPQSKEARDRERLGWLLVLPTVLGVTLVALYPVARTFYLSLTNARLRLNDDPEFIGLRHFGRLLSDSDFLNAIQNTLTFTVFSVFFEMLLGLIVALVINSNFKGRGLMRTAMLIPWAIPTVVSARMWQWMYNDVFGVVNDLLVTRLGILDQKIAWLANPSIALPAIIAVDVWKTTPFVALLLLAGLQVIPGDVYEAAVVDGANRWQQFWRITLPLLRPALVVTLIFRTLDAFRVFDVIYVMRGTSPDTVSLAVLTRQTLFDLRRIGEGSAMAVIIFLILAIFVTIYIRLVRVEEA
jgi:trehalose/maltose transport system permease protein